MAVLQTVPQPDSASNSKPFQADIANAAIEPFFVFPPFVKGGFMDPPYAELYGFHHASTRHILGGLVRATCSGLGW